MIPVYLLIYVPILLFVLAFLYETYRSIMRLKKPEKPSQYLDATWEVTHTLLVFGVVMLVMLFSRSLDTLGSAIFTSTMLAACALGVRAVCYIYIFYVKRSKRVDVVDWTFAASHLLAAVFLVVTVIQATIVLATKHPVANTQFIPYYIPGLVFVLGLCAVPLIKLYKTK